MYEGWQKVQAHLTRRLPNLTPEELQLKASPDGWPIWAAGEPPGRGRVYWLCGVFKEAGADATPFPDPLATEGWEDHLDVPRSSDELMFAMESSWLIVESCLNRWTPEMLGETFTRDYAGTITRHTRHSVLTRIVMHDSFHCGEVSLLLGMHGQPSLDPWVPLT